MIIAVKILGGTGVGVSQVGEKVSLVRPIDRNLYRDRNKVGSFFSQLKQFRRLATRYDKTASSFWERCISSPPCSGSSNYPYNLVQ